MHNAGGRITTHLPVFQEVKCNISRTDSAISDSFEPDSCQYCPKRLEALEGILLLDKDTELSTKYLYIGSPENVLEAYKHLPEEGPVTLMSAGDSEELTPLLSQKNANIFIFSLSLIPLYNKVQQVLSSYIKWTEELREILS